MCIVHRNFKVLSVRSGLRNSSGASPSCAENGGFSALGEHQWEPSGNGYNRHRRAFVTQSPRLPFRLELNSRARRLATFALFYLSEGIPVGFVTIALAAHLRGQGNSLTAVGAVVAATYAPWAFKWAWAPLVDLIHVRRFGHSRAWILLCQSAMVTTLAVLFASGLADNIALLTTLVFVHNVFAATQDVAIDAMAVRVLPPDEVGSATGLMFGAQYLGIGVGGSGALYVSDVWGFNASLVFVLALLGLLLVGVTIPLREPPDTSDLSEPRTGTLVAAIVGRLATFGRELRVAVLGGGLTSLTGALFAVCPQGAMALSLATATGLQVDLKMSQATIASVALLTNVAGGVGAVAGGWLSDRTRRPRTWVGVGYVLTAVVTAWLSLQFTGTGVTGLAPTGLIVAVTAYTFGFGVARGATTGLYMRLSSPAVAATQFTAYMALLNLAATYSSSWQGWYVDQFGYAAVLRLDALLGCVGLVDPAVGASDAAPRTGARARARAGASSELSRPRPSRAETRASRGCRVVRIPPQGAGYARADGPRLNRCSTGRRVRGRRHAAAGSDVRGTGTRAVHDARGRVRLRVALGGSVGT